MTLTRKTTAFLFAAALAGVLPARALPAPARNAEGTAAHLHQQKGVECASCHGTARKPAPAATERCLACHGPYDVLVEKTSRRKPLNPHASPHWGADIECNVCHRQHEKPLNWCAHCHTVPDRAP